jgi:dTDP-glucose 4,6-dehydratase
MTIQNRRILVTGGAGFVGSALVRHMIAKTHHHVLNVDVLNHAGQMDGLLAVLTSDRYRFARLDICDQARITDAIKDYRPEIIVHLAAETHVDRSIGDPAVFVKTNLAGTYSLLSATLEYWQSLPEIQQATFRFHHVSTDEVFGALGSSGSFSEDTAYDPRSPYSASKAGSDHLVRAWYHTYGLPVMITNSSNNYGPYQFPEKLIPFMIAKCLTSDNLPVYGNGQNVRDWIHVDDHVRALEAVFERGSVGETYLVGARCERTNLQVVQMICDVIDGSRPRSDGLSHREQITFVPDRPGHDFRYAIDPAKIENELGWRPKESFEEAMEKTIHWYIENEAWLRAAERMGSRT